MPSSAVNVPSAICAPAAAAFPADFRDESPREVSELLRARGIKPSKALGQNFLADGNVLDRIVDEARIGPGTGVVEVGPGLGALTARLLRAGARVTAVEKDPALQPLLEERFAGEPRFSLVRGDALETDFAALFAAGATHLVSNLPYSVGSRVVVDAATCRVPPRRMVLLLQKEVGRRFAAREGAPDRSAVSVVLQRRYDVSLARDVQASCFVPRPEVVSSVVVLEKHGRHPLPPDAAARFDSLAKAAFLHRRKQLASSMRHAGALSRDAGFVRAALRSAGAPETARPEDLSLVQWLSLASVWESPQALRSGVGGRTGA